MIFGKAEITGSIGNLEVGSWEIRRLESLKNRGDPDDEVHNYWYQVIVRSRQTGKRAVHEGHIEHRYGDGWWVLLHKALEDLIQRDN